MSCSLRTDMSLFLAHVADTSWISGCAIFDARDCLRATVQTAAAHSEDDNGGPKFGCNG